MDSDNVAEMGVGVSTMLVAVGLTAIKTKPWGTAKLLLLTSRRPCLLGHVSSTTASTPSSCHLNVSSIITHGQKSSSRDKKKKAG